MEQAFRTGQCVYEGGCPIGVGVTVARRAVGLGEACFRVGLKCAVFYPVAQEECECDPSSFSPRLSAWRVRPSFPTIDSSRERVALPLTLDYIRESMVLLSYLRHYVVQSWCRVGFRSLFVLTTALCPVLSPNLWGSDYRWKPQFRSN
jgi:hypothetical protein